MSQIKKHCEKTKELIENVDSKKVAKWLLEQGFYPEQYVLCKALPSLQK